MLPITVFPSRLIGLFLTLGEHRLERVQAAQANRSYFARRGCSPNRPNPAQAGPLRCAAG